MSKVKNEYTTIRADVFIADLEHIITYRKNWSPSIFVNAKVKFFFRRNNYDYKWLCIYLFIYSFVHSFIHSFFESKFVQHLVKELISVADLQEMHLYECYSNKFPIIQENVFDQCCAFTFREHLHTGIPWSICHQSNRHRMF